MNVIRGEQSVPEGKIAIVVARFNSRITGMLRNAAVATFLEAGLDEEQLLVVEVPGAFEIPGVARILAGRHDVEGILCLGAVVRGGTPHFEYVCKSVTEGLGTLAIGSPSPVVFGILTTDTIEQALERAERDRGDKGAELARATLEMADLYRQGLEG